MAVQEYREQLVHTALLGRVLFGAASPGRAAILLFDSSRPSMERVGCLARL